MEAAIDNVIQYAVQQAIKEKDWLTAIEYAQAFTNKILTGISLCLIYEALTGEMVINLFLSGTDIIEAIRHKICLN